jgi:hypothetical protein
VCVCAQLGQVLQHPIPVILTHQRQIGGTNLIGGRRLRHFKNVVETLHHTARGRKAIVSGKAQQANIGRRPNEVFLNLPVIDSVQKRLPIELYAQIGSVLGDFVRTVQIIS